MNFGNLIGEIGELTNKIPLEHLLSEEFINKYTEFATKHEFINKLSEKVGFNVETLQGVKEADSSKLNEFVSQFTEFNDWKSMISKAVQLYTDHKK